MKKKMKELLKLALMVTMAFSLVACGSDDESNDSKKDEKVTKEEQTTEAKGTPLEQFVESDEFQAQLKTALESVNDDELTMEVYAEENKLVYVYTYNEVIEGAEMIAAMKETLEASLEMQKSTFTTLADSMNTQLGVDDTVVVVRYQDANKTVIYEVSYSSN